MARTRQTPRASSGLAPLGHLPSITQLDAGVKPGNCEGFINQNIDNLCSLLQGGYPREVEIRLNIHTQNRPHPRLRPPFVHIKISTKILEEENRIRLGALKDYYEDEVNTDDVIQLRKLGLAIKESSLIKSLMMLGWTTSYDDDTVFRRAQRHLRVFLNGAQHNRSIKSFGLVLSDDILRYLTTILGGGQIRSLDLKGQGNHAQALALSNCISQLEHLDIGDSWINDDVSAELMMSACTNVETMYTGIGSDHQASALCSMIQNGRIRGLKVTPKDGILARRYGLEGQVNQRMFEMRLAKALCNTSSIQNIMASNHTLRCVYFSSSSLELLRPIVEINEMGYRKSKEIGYDKSLKWIIHKKVFGFYFIGDFDTTPFENIVPTVTAKVLSDIGTGRKETDLAAIFRLLKAFPCIMGG